MPEILTSKDYVDNNFLEAQPNAGHNEFDVLKPVTFRNEVTINTEEDAFFVNCNEIAFKTNNGNSIFIDGPCNFNDLILDKNQNEIKAYRHINEESDPSCNWLTIGVDAQSTFVTGPLYGTLYDNEGNPYLAPKHIVDTEHGAQINTDEYEGTKHGALVIKEGDGELRLMGNTGNSGTQNAPTIGSYRNTLMLYPGANGDISFVMNNGSESGSANINFENLKRLNNVLQGSGLQPLPFSTDTAMLDKHVYKVQVPESGIDLRGLQMENNRTAELWLDIPTFTSGVTNIQWPDIYWVDGTSSADGDHDVPVTIAESGRYHYVLRKEDGLLVCNMSYRTSIPSA